MEGLDQIARIHELHKPVFLTPSRAPGLPPFRMGARAVEPPEDMAGALRNVLVQIFMILRPQCLPTAAKGVVRPGDSHYVGRQDLHARHVGRHRLSCVALSGHTVCVAEMLNNSAEPLKSVIT